MRQKAGITVGLLLGWGIVMVGMPSVSEAQTTTRVSVATGGGQGNGETAKSSLNADGRFVSFDSDATKLVANDTNGVEDVFVYDQVSAAVGSPGGSDLDGDGTADLVWRNTSSGVVAVWLMNGTTIAASGFLGGVPAEWQIAGIGDVTGDGKADVIWRNSTGVVAVWVMNGLTITSVGFPGSTSTDWEVEGIGDVDGDGTADLIWRNTNSGVVAVWLMNGTTIAASGFLGGVPAEWQIAGIGDVTGDGKADVIWRNSTGVVAVWVMNGLTITSVGFPGSASTDWEVEGIGDVDGNGTADFIWRNTNSGAVVVWLMNGTTMASSGFFAGKSAEWEIAQVGDVDGDGKADVIWFNTSTGEVEVWLMNGLTIASTGSPGATSTDWEIQGGGDSNPPSVPPIPTGIPSITGLYIGTGTATNTNCSDSTINTNFTADIQVNILTQNGNAFTGETSVELAFDGDVFFGTDQLTGTVSATGDITGTIVGRFEATTHAGTFSGQVSGDRLSYTFSTQDTSGETCHTRGTVTASSGMGSPSGLVNSGDIIDLGEDGEVLVRINPVTGVQTLLSSSLIPGGNSFNSLCDIAIGPTGDLFLPECQGGPIVRFNVATGKSSIVSSSGFVFPRIAIDQNSSMWIANGTPTIRKLDIPTGVVTTSQVCLVLNPPSLNCNFIGANVRFHSAAFDPNGDLILVGTGIEVINGINYGVPAVYHLRVTRPIPSISGEVLTLTLITQANKLGDLRDVAVDSQGNIYVISGGAIHSNVFPEQVPNSVIKIHPTTGAQTVITSGSLLSSPWGIALEGNGNILVSKYGRGLIRVNPATGQQTVVSNSGNFDCCNGGIVVIP